MGQQGSLGQAVLDLAADGSGLIKDIDKNKPAVLGALDDLGKAGGALLAAGLMIAVTALVAITTMIWNAGQTLDSAYDSIAIKTGATGDALQGLQDDFDAVFSSVPTDADTAASAIGILNSKLGITGPVLQDTTKNLLEFSRLTKTDASANAEQFADIVSSWNIPVDKASSSLDVLFVAAQKTGVPVTDLMTAVQDSGPVLRQYGFSFEESAAFLAQMSKAGIDTGSVMQGLKSAAGKYAATGKPLNEGLAETLQLIKDAKDPTEALSLATDTFGGRAGPAMVDAIRSGKMGFEQLLPLLKNANGAIMDTSAATMDWGERWQMFQNKMTVALGPAGFELMGMVNALLLQLEDIINRPEIQAGMMTIVNGIVDLANQATTNLPNVINGFFQFVDFLKANQGIVVAILAVIGASLVAFGISAATAAWAALSPLLPVIAVIALVAAAAYLLYEAWVNNWGGIQDIMATFWAWLQPVLVQLYNWFATNIPIALQAVSDFWNSTLQPALAALGQWLAANLPGALAVLSKWIQDYVIWSFNNLMTVIKFVISVVQLLANYWTGTLWPAIQTVYAWMNGTLFPFLTALGNFINAVLSLGLKALAAIWQNILWPALQKVFQKLSNDLMPVFKALSDWWNTTGQPMAQAIAKWFGDNVTQAFAGLNKMLQDATGWLQNLASQLASMSLPDWMTPGSPTPWQIGLEGVDKALRSVANVSLPQMSTELGAMPAPIMAGSGVQLSSSSGGGLGSLVIQPFISTGDVYDAERILRPYIEKVIREQQKK